jgi:hypothetical protein
VLAFISSSLVSQTFQYVKTTLANLNEIGHEYFRLRR